MSPGSQPVWINANFLRLWIGQSASILGSQVTIIALPFTAVLVLRASAFQIGLLGVAQFSPSLLFGLVSGLWVDRKRRRPLLIAADLGRGLLLATIPIGSILGLLRIEQLYVIGFLTGTLSVLFDVAYPSFLPSIVGRRALIDGNSKLALSYSSAQWVGPALAGWLVQIVGPPDSIAVDAASFLLSAAFLLTIRTHEVPAVSSQKGNAPVSELAEGLQFVLGHPLLKPIAACMLMDTLFSSMLFAVYVPYVAQDLHLAPAVYGLVVAMFGPGSVLGAVLAPRVSKQFGIGKALLAARGLIGAGNVFRAVAGGPPVLIDLFLIAGHIQVGLGNRLFGINQLSLRQAVTPSRLQGRMNAVMRLADSGTMPIGAFLGGSLGTMLGLRSTMIIAAVGVLCSGYWLYASPVRRLREHPDVMEDMRPEQ